MSINLIRHHIYKERTKLDMTKTPEPNWQPISALSMIANMIDGQLEESTGTIHYSIENATKTTCVR